MVILYGQSAWEYYRTPPVIRDEPIPNEVIHLPYPEGAEIPSWATRTRRDAPETTRVISARLPYDLKGLALPVHVLCDTQAVPRQTRLVAYHRRRVFLPKSELIPLGGNLFVTSPALTLVHLALTGDLTGLLLNIFEACGTYASPARNPWTRYATDQLFARGYLAHVQSLPASGAYYDADGRPEPFTTREGDPLPWRPWVDRFGKAHGTWSRPPLTTVEDVALLAEQASRTRGARLARRAASLALNGSASPLETRMALFACLPPNLGGEGWPAPQLNRRVHFPRELQKLAGARSAVADLLWSEPMVDLETNGENYHADENGFALENGRRAALEALGYTVMDISYEQLADVGTLDLMMGMISQRLGFSAQSRSARFIAARDALHERLFDKSHPW